MSIRPKIGDILRLDYGYDNESLYIVTSHEPPGEAFVVTWTDKCWVQMGLSTEGLFKWATKLTWGSDIKFYTKVGEATPLQKAIYLNED